MSERWKKIRGIKSCPQEGEEVLLFIPKLCGSGIAVGRYWERGNYFVADSEFYEISEVTGWRDVPRLPDWAQKREARNE